MKKVLVAPLDWGLGHATRCIPVIHELLKLKCIVFLAGRGDSLLLLRKEFPLLSFFFLEGYDPVYPANGSMGWSMAKQLVKFSRVIKKEHEQVEALINEHKIDLIISDNRYGCWSEKIPSVIITHQLNILMPKHLAWLQKLINGLNESLLKKFSCCWVPDYPEEENSLAGKLSFYDGDSLPHVTHIGPISRLCNVVSHENKYEVTCVFSGPEPQRSIFEKIVTEQLLRSGLHYFVARGTPSNAGLGLLESNKSEFLNSEALQTVISQSSIVIARSGYSMIMDLASMGKKAILIPTPGQTEQEYLADRWKEKGIAYSMTQHNFDLKAALIESNAYAGFKVDFSRSKKLLSIALNQVLLIA